VLPRRLSRPEPQSSFTDSERHLILAAETLRASDAPVPLKSHRDDKPEERISLFWRLFGGTILSICALVVINAYQSLNNNIHEVRSDLGRVRDTSIDFVRKDEFNSRQTTMWNSIRDLQALQSSVSVLGNKSTTLEQQAATAERDHKELLAVVATLTTLRDKDAILEKLIKEAENERREVTRELQLLRERLAKLEGQAEKKSSP
jgi:hypothetical protein